MATKDHDQIPPAAAVQDVIVHRHLPVVRQQNSVTARAKDPAPPEIVQQKVAPRAAVDRPIATLRQPLIAPRTAVDCAAACRRENQVVAGQKRADQGLIIGGAGGFFRRKERRGIDAAGNLPLRGVHRVGLDHLIDRGAGQMPARFGNTGTVSGQGGVTTADNPGAVRKERRFGIGANRGVAEIKGNAKAVGKRRAAKCTNGSTARSGGCVKVDVVCGGAAVQIDQGYDKCSG